MRFEKAAEGEIQTSGGSIEVTFDEEAPVSIEARTSGGRVSLDEDFSFRGKRQGSKLEGEVNGGGPRLTLKTSGGNIRIKAD